MIISKTVTEKSRQKLNTRSGYQSPTQAAWLKTQDQVPEEIYLFSLSNKESEITDFILGTSIKDEVQKIMSVQKQMGWLVEQVQSFCHY